MNDMNNKENGICIVGAGPGGLFLAKFLSKKIPITLFEKNSDILGNYKFAKDLKRKNFDKIINHKNIKLNLSTEFNPRKEIEDKDKYKCYVNATGGIPAKPIGNSLLVFELIKKYFKKANYLANEKKILPKKINIMKDEELCREAAESLNLQRDLVIIGMGNVTLDFAHHFKNSVDKITAISRSGLNQAKFDSYELKNIFKYFNVQFYNTEKDADLDIKKFKLKNKSILTKIFDFFSFKPKLNLIFNCNSSNVEKNSIKLILNKNKESNGTTKKENSILNMTGNMILSSNGFVPNTKLKFKTDNIPVYNIGWSKNPRGNISDLLFEAKSMALRISEDLKL